MNNKQKTLLTVSNLAKIKCGTATQSKVKTEVC